LKSAPLATLPQSEHKPVKPYTVDFDRDSFPPDFVRDVIRVIENQPKAKKQGDWINCCSPLREDKNASFGFNVKTLAWHDFNGDSGGIIKLGQQLGIDIADYHTPNMGFDNNGHCHKTSGCEN